MKETIDIELYRKKEALTKWLADCKKRMSLRFPEIDFCGEYWPIKSLYNTKAPDWSFTKYISAFASLDNSFCDVLRCLVAEMVLKNARKDISFPVRGYCLVSQLCVKSIYNLSLQDMKKCEDYCLENAKKNPAAASMLINYLNVLKIQLEHLASKGVIHRLGFHPSQKVKTQLINISKQYRKNVKSNRIAMLDRKIESFNEAVNALYNNDKRLTSIDRVVIALVLRLMCAPSRVNEILCTSIDDQVVINDYASKSSIENYDTLQGAHQLLLIMMKGSKGSSWSAKPALKFMIDAYKYTTNVIIAHGERSRKLVDWYQKFPEKLYLPAELEHLRDHDLNVSDLSKIVYMTNSPTEQQVSGVRVRYKQLFSEKIKEGNNSNCNNLPAVVKYVEVERCLLEKVKTAMNRCRKVTKANHYEGNLANMLSLVDMDNSPYLPAAINYSAINRRLGQEAQKKESGIFKKLGITMPDNGRVVDAWIGTHDPRRWLTTQALRHGEKLSDVLINKWANRLHLYQMDCYDLRAHEELAATCTMSEIPELEDISKGIRKVEKLVDTYGLHSSVVVVNDANISVTSMDMVMKAVDDRPVAQTSEQIIILYPSQFGVCLHQHHETPCRNYSSCLPCDNDVVVKGHSPTNDNIRNRSVLLHRSIVRQIDRLIVEANREIADDMSLLEKHITLLIRNGLDRDQMADFIIEEFHRIKDAIEDKLFAKRVEEAFVAKGIISLLDDSNIDNGALIKYQNQTYHASPRLEKAIDSNGGMDEILKEESLIVQKYPCFASKRPNVMRGTSFLSLISVDSEE